MLSISDTKRAMSPRLRTLLAATCVLWAGTATANATPLSSAQILSQFNVVVFGNFSDSSDVQGRAVVGGNLIAGAGFNQAPGSAAGSSFPGLTVYGNETGSNGFAVNGGVTILGSNNAALNLNSGGNVYVGGSNSGTINDNGGVATASINGNNTGQVTLNGGGTVRINGDPGNVTVNGGTGLFYTGSSGALNMNNGAVATHTASAGITPPAPVDFNATFKAPMTALSTQLAEQSANSSVSISAGKIIFNAAPNASGVAVFDISTSLFSANSAVTINLDGATSVLINVDVDSCAGASCAYTFLDSVNFLNPASYADEVLWNFVNATGLTFSNEFGGTILAPEAAVSNRSQIDGTLVADSFSGTGELHSYPYTGILPGTVATPEPTSLLIFGMGLAGLGAIRFRRRKA